MHIRGIGKNTELRIQLGTSIQVLKFTQLAVQVAKLIQIKVGAASRFYLTAYLKQGLQGRKAHG